MTNNKDTKCLKKEIRKILLEKRKSIDEETRLKAVNDFTLCLTSLNEYNCCQKILLYASYGTELSTDLVIKKALFDGKEVYLPKVIGSNIEFFRIRSLDNLSGKGYKGIREPEDLSERYIFSTDSLLIMPGVGFDKEGYRLGYGGGFYDRFLAENPVICEKSISVGFKMQETDHIPHEETDIKPGKILLF